MVSMLPLPVGFIVAQQAVLYHMVSRVDIPTRTHTHIRTHTYTHTSGNVMDKTEGKTERQQKGRAICL